MTITYDGWKIPRSGRRSRLDYLDTPTMILKIFVCQEEKAEHENGRAYVFPARCTYPGRHHCAESRANHDPGDEDANP